MSVWIVLPSARPAKEADECLQKWLDMGYHTAVYREEKDGKLENAMFQWYYEYIGWGASINSLCRVIFAFDYECKWIVGGADDIDPDPLARADDIADQCTEHFKGTLGIMQPTGDPFLDHGVRTVCGSPFIGREFSYKFNSGKGPFWPDYYHYYADAELHLTASRSGLLWNRDDLTHMHHHWSRYDLPRPDRAERPYANFQQDLDLFEKRKAEGFPGAELL